MAASEPKPDPGNPSQSIEELFAALESPLLLYAMKLTQSAATAQDLVQEAFLRLHQRQNEVRQPRPWLYRTVHNLAINLHRKQNKIIPLETASPAGEHEAAADPGILPDAQLERLEALGLTRLFLRKLDPKMQTVVLLKFEEDLTYKEISEATGLSISYVGYILSTALKKLGADLRQAGVAP